MPSKNILITGGTKGLGLAAAAHLLQQGHQVAVCSNDQSSINVVNNQHPSIITDYIDVTDSAQVEQWITKSKDKLGSIDVLINNAGIGYYTDVAEADLAKWDLMWKVNVSGIVHTCRYTIPVMKQQRAGQIINISSIAGKVAHAHSTLYAATKFAVMGITQGLRAEVINDNIKIAAICPGFMNAEFMGAAEVARRTINNNGQPPAQIDINEVVAIINFIINTGVSAQIEDITITPMI